MRGLGLVSQRHTQLDPTQQANKQTRRQDKVVTLWTAWLLREYWTDQLLLYILVYIYSIFSLAVFRTQSPFVVHLFILFLWVCETMSGFPQHIKLAAHASHLNNWPSNKPCPLYSQESTVHIYSRSQWTDTHHKNYMAPVGPAIIIITTCVVCFAGSVYFVFFFFFGWKTVSQLSFFSFSFLKAR